MSSFCVLRRGLPLLVLAAVLLALPHGKAAWTEEYGKLDELGVEFRGLACRPTSEETSSQRFPRSDILGVESLQSDDVFLDEGYMQEDGRHFQFNGDRNENKNPRNVEGDPRAFSLLGDGDYEIERAVSLGKAGWFLGKMERAVPDGAGDDLAVYESDATTQNPDSGNPNVGEPFCVFAANREQGPFTFVGVHDPDDQGEPGGAFDLATYYVPLGGERPVNYVIVLDSDTAKPFFDVSLSADKTSPVPSLEEVTFTDGSDLQGFKILTRAWSIDGEVVADTPSTLTFAHAFQKPGARQVCLALVVELEINGQPEQVPGDACTTFQVINQEPEAALAATPESPDIGEVFELDASQSFDPEDRLRDRYEWDLGDGTTATTPVPYLKHRYDQKGSYDVTVTVADLDGGEHAATLVVATENNPPAASFQVLDDTGTRLNDITFDASASTDPDGDRLTYHWDFGDGTVEEGHGAAYRVVKYAYEQLSPDAQTPYVVTLTVRDDYNGKGEATEEILILHEPPVADFSGPSSVLSLEPATFIDQSTAGDHALDDSARTWTVQGAGALGGDESIEHAFPRPGSYTVELRVQDSNGGYGVARKTVTVGNRAPTVDASPLELPSATRVPVLFAVDAGDLDGEVVSWLWDLGDGTTSADPEPRHAYAATGSYALSLTVTDDMGARTVWRPGDDGLLHITNEAPAAQMTVSGDPDAPERVRFQDASSDDGEVVAWAWYFDDGVGDPKVPDSDQPEATHAFPDADGTYRVRLAVTDDEGVTWDIVRYVRPAQLATGGDADGDGVQDGIDNCLDEPNPDQRDADADGVGDACVDLDGDPDGDADGDGVPNSQDAFPFDPAEQTDSDGDGVGDQADSDTDGDGIPDAEELILGTNRFAADSDGDGVSDGQELAAGTDPLAAPEEPPLPPEPTQEAEEPERRSLAWLWAILGLFGAAAASVGAVLVVRRRRPPKVAWRSP